MRGGMMLMGWMVLAATLAPGQPRGGAMGPMAEQGPQFLFYEAVVLPVNGDSAHVRVDVHYRIDREFFIPVKNPDNGVPDPFRRRGELMVELNDTSGAPGGRATERIELGEGSAERKPPGHDWRQGILSVTVAPGTYKVVLSVDDLESKRNFTDNSRVLRIGPGRTGLEAADFFFVAPIAADSLLPAFLPIVNYGVDVLFGRPSALAVAWRGTAADDSVLSARISFAQFPPAEEDLDRLPPAVTERPRIYRGVSLMPLADAERPGYTLARGGSTSLAIVPFPSGTLLLRAYNATLSLSAGASRAKEVVRHFRTVWPDMPLSLKDIDYALDALRYVTTEEQLDSLRRGSMEARRKNLESFWRLRDRSPGSSFNEVQTEYYRRVDYAMRNFGTLRMPDGFRSDRGKIYILYGPPTRTDRSLDPAAGFQEVWVYEKIKKEFRFVDPNKSGTYVLVTKPQ